MPDQQHEGGSTRATAHLPRLAIEILHRRSADDDAEFISINLQAVPSSEAFGRYLETVNPFVLCRLHGWRGFPGSKPREQ
jgi:hypothetical protein